ncbi:FUSC family protein [Myxococcaceae bacterium GXIMD 01537]
MMRRLVEHTKEMARFAPVRPSVKAGLRAAVASILPVLIASAIGLPEGGLWLSLGGFNASIADKGGSYRFRATSMGTVALAGALSVFIGGNAGRFPVLVAIPLTLLWVAACSYARVYGAAFNIAGNTAAITFVIALALPAASTPEALTHAGLLILGALWAMVLSLVLWPLRPYRPARFAVGRCYREVADYLSGAARATAGAGGEDWHALILRAHGPLRETLEDAGATLAATRRGRHTESGRGERLLVLLQASDALFGTAIALGDLMEGLSRDERALPARAEVAGSLLACAQTLRELARVIETEGRVEPMPELDWGDEELRAFLARTAEAGGAEALSAVDQAEALHAAHLVARMRQLAGTAVETAASLPDDRPFPGERPFPRSDEAVPEHPILGPLRDNFTLDSVVLRHALRVGLTAAVAVWIATSLRPSHGYWITITVIAVMQPYTGPTFQRGLQRALGTVLGGILAAAIAAWLHDPHAILAFVFCTAAIGVAVMPLNYALYSVFLTVTFVLLAEVGTGDWSLAQVRIVNTLIGGALALAGTWLLWERPEQELFPEQMAEALKADRDYFREVMSARLEGRQGPDPALAEARRRMGLASNNAEASFQRLLSEPRRRTEPLEPLMTLLAFTRRFATAVVAFSSARHRPLTEPLRTGLERFATTTEQVLEDLADAVLHGRPPAPLPDYAEVLGSDAPGHEGADPLLRAQLDRVVRQLGILHGAAARRGAPAGDAQARLSPS